MYVSNPSENVTIPSKVNDPVSASQKISSDNTSDTLNITTKNYNRDNFPLLT